jgi:DNA-binding MarR family transcriptional regulator
MLLKPAEPHPAAPFLAADSWRLTHMGRLMGGALRRFDERVLQLMAANVDLPLSLANVARRTQVTAAQIHLTRHLDVQGNRITTLAERAGMTKQAMKLLVDQCEAWGLVERSADGRDGRAKIVRFTATGRLWLEAFRLAVAQAESEMRDEVGAEVAAVLSIGLEIYAQGLRLERRKVPRIS